MANIYLTTFDPTLISGTNFAAKTQSGFCFSYYIDSPKSKDYPMALGMPHAGFILTTVAKCVSGTATGTFKVINPTLGVLPCPPHPISGEKSYVDFHFVSFTTGDDLTLNVVASSDCSDLTFNVNYIRGLN